MKHGKSEESWGAIVDKLNKTPLFPAQASTKKAREQFNKLTKAYRADQASKKSSTGTDDESVTEMDSLLQYIIDLIDDADNKK